MLNENSEESEEKDKKKKKKDKKEKKEKKEKDLHDVSCSKSYSFLEKYGDLVASMDSTDVQEQLLSAARRLLAPKSNSAEKKPGIDVSKKRTYDSSHSGHHNTNQGSYKPNQITTVQSRSNHTMTTSSNKKIKFEE